MRQRLCGDDSVIWQTARSLLSHCRSTDASLWSNKSGKRKLSQQDDGCWECDKQPFICNHGNGPSSSCMGFSGLYILCSVGLLKCQFELENTKMLRRRFQCKCDLIGRCLECINTSSKSKYWISLLLLRIKTGLTKFVLYLTSVNCSLMDQASYQEKHFFTTF